MDRGMETLSKGNFCFEFGGNFEGSIYFFDQGERKNRN